MQQQFEVGKLYQITESNEVIQADTARQKVRRFDVLPEGAVIIYLGEPGVSSLYPYEILYEDRMFLAFYLLRDRCTRVGKS